MIDLSPFVELSDFVVQFLTQDQFAQKVINWDRDGLIITYLQRAIISALKIVVQNDLVSLRRSNQSSSSSPLLRLR